MGEYRDERGVRCFTPDNGERVLHIDSNLDRLSISDLIERAQDHFGPDVDLSMVQVDAEHIQTSCLGLDYYDPSDHDDFIVLSRLND